MDLIKESYVTESPDLTSIIAELEAKRNPINLFFKEELRSSKYLEEKLNFIDDKIEDLREWLTTCYPHMHLDKFNYKRCLIKLIEIEDKLIAVNNMYRRNAYSNEKNTLACNYKVTCAQCDTQFILSNSKDLSNLENHIHAVDILSAVSLLPQEMDVEEDPPQPQQIATAKQAQNDHTDDFPIQSISNIRNHFRCLLCQVFFRGKKSLRSHVSGKLHLKKLNNVAVYTKMSDFVKYFQQLPRSFQVFQVLFDPAPQDAPSNVVFCTICSHIVPIEDVPEHVTCNQTHRLKFQSLDYSFLNGYKEMVDIMRNAMDGCVECDEFDEPISEKTAEHGDNVEQPSTSTNISINKIMKNIKDKSPKKNKRQHTIIQSYACGNNETPEATEDLLPHRLKNHLKFIDDTDSHINDKHSVCTLCKFTIESPRDLVAHIVSDQHKLKSRLEFNEALRYYCYYCCLCCKYFKRDAKWVEHLSSTTHTQKFVFISLLC